MVKVPSNWIKLNRGILGPVSGSNENITIQKNNVIRIKKDTKKKR